MRTYFTFSGPVTIPGATLPAGKYLFRIADTSSRNIVQVLSEDGTKSYSLFFILRSHRNQIPEKPEVRFLETRDGMTRAIRTWWYPGNSDGYEFVYSKKQARLLAKGTGTPVLSAQSVAPAATPPELLTITPTGEETAAVETAEAIGTSLAGEIAPTELVVAEVILPGRAALPQTASSVPILCLLGLAFLLFAALIRWSPTLT
jgi:hypothetical protein